MRVLETECSTAHGMTLKQWYWMELIEREYKVGAMLLPRVLATLDSMNMVSQLRYKRSA